MKIPLRPASGMQTRASDAEFEALFQQQWEPLCRMLFQLTGDWDEAQDLALESFLRLYRHPPAEDRSRIGWLYRVAVNLGLNLLRSRKRRRQYEDQVGLQELHMAQSSDPSADVESRLEQQRVRLVLLKLKPRAARILLLRYSGLSYAEIAAALGISPASVGTLLARAERSFEEAYHE